MKEYVINTRNMMVGYIENDHFHPIAMLTSSGDCGFAMDLINLDE